MTWMKWNYKSLKNFVDRNKLGLILGLIKGIIISYLFWTKSDYLSQEIMKYLTYPLHLIFGCDVQFIGLAILVLIYGIIGLCFDAIISKWQIKNDRNRALIILAILILLIFGGNYYRTTVSEDLCIDVNLDGVPDDFVDLDEGGNGDTTQITNENNLGLEVSINIG